MSLRETALFIGAGGLALVLQSTVISYLGNDVLQPDLLLVILAFVALRGKGTGGVWLALFLGYLADLFSAGPFGAYLFVYVGFFFIVQQLSSRLLLQSRWAQMALVGGMGVLAFAGVAGLNAIASISIPPEVMALRLAGRSISTAVAVVVLFPVLSRAENLVAPRSGTLRISA